MNESCETPDVVEVYENGVLVLPRQSSLRFSLPMIYAGVGIALGILTGTSLALSGMPGSSSLALFSNSAPSSTSESAAQAAAVSAPAAAAAYVPVVYVQPVVAATSSPAVDRALVIHPVHRVSTSKHTHPNQIFPATRILLTSPVAPATPAERERTRPAAHPVVKPARRLLASAPPALQEPMAVAPNLDGTAQIPTFYTEGDLMVVAFDAANGTIESADGRTFTVGQTVSLGSTQSWNEYRSDVHYRCAADGNCTLMRPGVIATDARAI